MDETQKISISQEPLRETTEEEIEEAVSPEKIEAGELTQVIPEEELDKLEKEIRNEKERVEALAKSFVDRIATDKKSREEAFKYVLDEGMRSAPNYEEAKKWLERNAAHIADLFGHVR